MSDMAFDVLIAGGGVIGSSIAYHLALQSQGTRLRIGVVERDPTYREASSALSVGGARQQFSTPENILLSRYSVEFFRRAGTELAVGGEEPELGFQENGYLFLATAEGIPILERNHTLQIELGASVMLLGKPELKNLFPWMDVSDLEGGSLGTRGEGWLDPYSLLQAFKAKAKSLGVEYLNDEVVGFGHRRGRLETAELAGAGAVSVGSAVNAAGPRAHLLASMAGIRDLPVRPRKRFVYGIKAGEVFSGCPLVIDPTGVYFRPEGDGYLCGVSPPKTEDPDALDLVMDYRLFEETVWPTLARRVPAFDSLRLGSSWAGHYAYNTEDQNAILGLYPGLENFFLANGFSGHGLQHAPGIGRALSELILHGEYRTLDLTRFGVSRFSDGSLIHEENVV
jgi:sarcosine oxidase